MNTQFTPMDYDLDKADRKRKEQYSDHTRLAQEVEQNRPNRFARMMDALEQTLTRTTRNLLDRDDLSREKPPARKKQRSGA